MIKQHKIQTNENLIQDTLNHTRPYTITAKTQVPTIETTKHSIVVRTGSMTEVLQQGFSESYFVEDFELDTSLFNYSIYVDFGNFNASNTYVNSFVYTNRVTVFGYVQSAGQTVSYTIYFNIKKVGT